MGCCTYVDSDEIEYASLKSNEFKHNVGYHVFDEITKNIHIPAEILNVKPDELQMHSFYSVLTNYGFIYNKNRDTILSVVGISDNVPVLNVGALHTGKSLPYGYIRLLCRKHQNVYTTASQEEIDYVILHTKDNQSNSQKVIISRKGQLWKIKRHLIAVEKTFNKKHTPILRENLVNEVITNTIGFLLRRKEIAQYGVRIRRGLLLDGPPGNGKTMLCRYIQELCTDNAIDWGIVTSSALDHAYQNNELNTLFQTFTVTFFDDVDISYLDRGSGNGKMACSILSAMDGMDQKSDVVRIFTTNEKIDKLDKAFTRPGRIDCTFTINKPDASLRRKLVESWPEEMISHIDIDALIIQSDDFSFAELEAIRSNLVTNFIFNQEWNLNKAFKDFSARREEIKPDSTLGYS